MIFSWQKMQSKHGLMAHSTPDWSLRKHRRDGRGCCGRYKTAIAASAHVPTSQVTVVVASGSRRRMLTSGLTLITYVSPTKGPVVLLMHMSMPCLAVHQKLHMYVRQITAADAGDLWCKHTAAAGGCILYPPADSEPHSYSRFRSILPGLLMLLN